MKPVRCGSPSGLITLVYHVRFFCLSSGVFVFFSDSRSSKMQYVIARLFILTSMTCIRHSSAYIFTYGFTFRCRTLLGGLYSASSFTTYALRWVEAFKLLPYLGIGVSAFTDIARFSISISTKSDQFYQIKSGLALRNFMPRNCFCVEPMATIMLFFVTNFSALSLMFPRPVSSINSPKSSRSFALCFN